MGGIIQKARIILIGCGPHARRVYLPALRGLDHIELRLVIDLESQENLVRSAVGEDTASEIWLIKPFTGAMPLDLVRSISAFVRDNGVTGVIIATEPLVHMVYAEWALDNELSVLIDKPITTRANAVSDIKQAESILADYRSLLQKYQKIQLEKESIFMVNSQRRFHKGFQFVNEKIREVAEKTNCPVTFIHAYHCDGQWRLPSEIVTQEYHPYCFGYGKVSHSGYHILDAIYQFYKAAALGGKLADSMEIASSFVQPNGFFTQLTQEDYRAVFGDRYESATQWSDEQLRPIFNDFVEIDISAILTLKKDDVALANFSVNLLHNGFAGRTWLQPGADLYKGNGRIKHESYQIQQGPFQNIQIHAYQGSDKHDEDRGAEDDLGGKNHFDVYVFRNPMVAGFGNQPQVYKLTDILEVAGTSSSSMVAMDLVKHKVVEEFADYLTGRKNKSSIQSQIEDHLVPVQMMSGIYAAHIARQRTPSQLVEVPFGLANNTV